ncbi:hypothetical protein vseg_005749 [Gypsophila vaccaria]
MIPFITSNFNDDEDGNENRNRRETCAACKFQRRRCFKNCILAPYFPASKADDFLKVNKLFGFTRVLEIVTSVPAALRHDAVTSIIYTAEARSRFPAGGCVFIIQTLEHRLSVARAELDLVLAQLATFRTPARPGPGSRVGPRPGSHVGPRPGSRVGPGPGSRVGPGPGSRVGPGPGSRVGPGPGSRVGSGPGSRVRPGPGFHVWLGPSSHVGPVGSCLGTGQEGRETLGEGEGSSSGSNLGLHRESNRVGCMGGEVDLSLGLWSGSSSGLDRQSGHVTQMGRDDDGSSVGLRFG